MAEEDISCPGTAVVGLGAGVSQGQTRIGDAAGGVNDQIQREARFSGDPVERLVVRVAFLAKSIRERSALLTASSFGNTCATSGFRTIILDDSFIRFAYLPRTKPPGKSERLYSSRNSSLSDSVFFFIEFSLSFARPTSAYNSNVIVLFNVDTTNNRRLSETPKVI
jgi:hypothetical protein